MCILLKCGSKVEITDKTCFHNNSDTNLCKILLLRARDVAVLVEWWPSMHKDLVSIPSIAGNPATSKQAILTIFRDFFVCSKLFGLVQIESSFLERETSQW